MPGPEDFRLYDFTFNRITSSGRYLGHRTYWKLYVLENVFRVVINSVLSVEMNRDWWERAVDQETRKTVEWFRKQYSKQMWRSNPGKHGLYYVSLGDLNEIMRVHANLLSKVIPEIDEWLIRIDKLRIPRNTVAHMNYPVRADLDLIDELYELSRGLVPMLEKKKIKPVIPL